jgi:hypothetical protein
MDAINGTSLGTLASTTAKKTFGAQVVTGTLDRLNTNQNGDRNLDYDFQTKVLSGMGIGSKLDVEV